MGTSGWCARVAAPDGDEVIVPLSSLVGERMSIHAWQPLRGTLWLNVERISPSTSFDAETGRP